MTSPYGPSGGNDPQPQWGQQPYGGGYPGTPSGGFPAQQPNPYGQPDPSQQQPQQPQWGQQPPQPQQYTQQYPGGYDPTQQQQPAPQQNPYGQPDPAQQWGQQPQPGQYGQQPNPYGQHQNPYGQPNPYGQQPPAKKSGAVVWVVVALVVLVVAAFGITGFVTPGFLKKKVFDNAEVQKGVVRILTDDYKISDVESATCPADREVKPNTTFECTAKVAGKDKKVKITVKTADGEYEVGQPAG
ncbi:DUF4333 domain-containing protein [Actinosynnema sp. NPDC020468]|uniref:DUF4333 domain-containing protein n=1 Tax=Actinosynnema sp. NPDC020468 TaxID=3154488 RepID=UPI0033EF3B47